MSTERNMKYENFVTYKSHKATVQELIEHFSKKEEKP